MEKQLEENVIENFKERLEFQNNVERKIEGLLRDLKVNKSKMLTDVNAVSNYYKVIKIEPKKNKSQS